MAATPQDANNVAEHFFSDQDTLCRQLADDMEDWLNAGLGTRERASLVVSGGSTPVPLFHAVRIRRLPWARVDVTLADERWVDPEHKDSNARLVHTELLQDLARYAAFTPLKSGHATPEEAVPQCEERLQRLPMPFDVVVLGMGGDGHTASLFPHAPTLDADLAPDSPRLCTPGHPQTAPHPRMSMTLAALLNARRVVLHLSGDDKRAVYEEAKQGNDAHAMPIRAVLQQPGKTIDVYWAP